MFNGFICPVCGSLLTDKGLLYLCPGNHCFDKSKFGYVNLLLSQKSSAKRHGDDRVMIRARRDFLSAGYYSFLRDKLCEILFPVLGNDALILDAGCGECYYSEGIKDYAAEHGKNFEIIGVDISKDALEFASKRKCGVVTAVASLFALPIAGDSCDAVLNIFSPEADAEFRRVLRNNGYLIRVIPLENHLYELKRAVYDNPYKNEVPDSELDGFELSQEVSVSQTLNVEGNENIINLFKMTPYYYKTGREDQNKLQTAESLQTQAEFCIRVYRKVD